MPSPRNKEDGPPRAGYITAIIVSALGHAGLFAAVFFLAPRWLQSDAAPPPTYTVKIVDNIPAGDLGSHLPTLAPSKTEQKAEQPPPKPEPKVEKPPEPKLDKPDENAIALNQRTPEAAPTPTPTPEPTPEATPPPPSPTVEPTPVPTRAPKKHPTPESKAKGKSTPIVIAKAEPTPSIKQRLDKLKKQLLAESLKQRQKEAEDEDSEDEDEDTEATPVPGGATGGGPVVGSIAREGKGYGIGPGTGSMGMLQDPAFLLYYQTVQDRIKKAWSFMGGSSDLTATVQFSIGPDGSLTGLKVANTSKDTSFDDSVLRAIKRAAPFPAPPDKYKSEFQQGIEAQFSLGDLKS